MTSSTDVLSCDSLTEDQAHTPRRHTRSSHLTSPHKPKLTDEVLEDIEDLLERVPQVNKVFTVINKIGSGTFSSVYLAKLKQEPQIQQQFALKHIIPTSHPSRIESELRCLYEIGGSDNVMGVEACFRERDHVVIVMPHFAHDRFQDYYRTLTLGDVQEYMKNLLASLRRVHQVDIIHRDVKPSNFLFNKAKKQYALVDFGLAQKAPVLLKNAEENSIVSEKDANEAKSCQSPDGADGQSPEGSSVEVPHSKRKCRKLPTESPSSVSPKKRKFSTAEGEENNTESPPACKRRQLSDTPKPLSNIDPNVHTTASNNENTKPETADSSKHRTQAVKITPPNIMQSAFSKLVKSPRRMLLTKRAIEKQTCLEDDLPQERATCSKKTPVIVVNEEGKSVYKAVSTSVCRCFGKPTICSICMSRRGQHAPRAGTPGFRAPEVLMKCPDQTTAVDVWAAGVMFMSLLSGRYPFFKAPDDLTALAQIMCVVGSQEMKAAALTFGKNLICSPRTPPVDLRLLCTELRKHAINNSKRDKDCPWKNIPDSTFKLLTELLNPNPTLRITAEQALNHPFFSEKFP